MDLQGAKALVTGGSEGIGKAIAVALKREGAATEVADTVAYLAFSDSGLLTGVNLDINGGLFYS